MQTSVLDTIFETEFFPTTIFTSKFTIPPDPTTVIETSTVTSTSINTKLEPIYFTTTEIVPKSFTATVTQFVPDPRQILNQAAANPTPQVIVKTVTKEVFLDDINPPFTSTQTVTVTRTERVRESDCPDSPNALSGNGFFDFPGSSKSLSPRPFLAGSSLISSLNDISHSNSDPLKSFTEPIPSTFRGSNPDLGSYYGSFFSSVSSPLDPKSHSLFPNPDSSSSFSRNQFDANKLFDLYSSSLNTNQNQDLSSLQFKVANSNVDPFGFQPDVDFEHELPQSTFSSFTPDDVSFRPSRPDPTSISDILESEYPYTEDQSSSSTPIENEGSLDNVYNTVSIYHSDEHDPSLQEGDVYIKDYSDQGGPIHIKEIMKGVQGGEIHEVIHNYGLTETGYGTGATINNFSGSNFYDSGPPVYHPQTLDDWPLVSDSRTKLSTLLRGTLNLDDTDRKIYAISPKMIEYDGYSEAPHPSIPLQPQTLFRSEFLRNKLPSPLNRQYRAILSSHRNYGAQKSMPIVLNVNGTIVDNIFANTSSNTFTPLPGSSLKRQQPISASFMRNVVPDSDRSRMAKPNVNFFMMGQDNHWMPLILDKNGNMKPAFRSMKVNPLGTQKQGV